MKPENLARINNAANSMGLETTYMPQIGVLHIKNTSSIQRSDLPRQFPAVGRGLRSKPVLKFKGTVEEDFVAITTKGDCCRVEASVSKNVPSHLL